MPMEGAPNNDSIAALSGPSLSARLRDETADVHDAAERSRFMTALLNDDGPLAVDAYVRLLSQYLPIYRALEAAAATHRADPVVAELAHPGLDRAGAIAADLAALGSSADESAAFVTDATRAYVARIETASDRPSGFVAHHYVRYLGDLSGGQIIRRILRRRLGHEDDRALSFYVFDQIDNGVQFKKAYRERLDTAPWSDAEADHLVIEARAAFELNLAVFESLEPFLAADTVVP